ncbi:hypothetical protein FO519_002268 [Halicephalobus sp. NKZ332]|nr:hypothetical protein FO519_002268 [Halicephalobus sp. NKZ332]
MKQKKFKLIKIDKFDVARGALLLIRKNTLGEEEIIDISRFDETVKEMDNVEGLQESDLEEGTAEEDQEDTVDSYDAKNARFKEAKFFNEIIFKLRISSFNESSEEKNGKFLAVDVGGGKIDVLVLQKNFNELKIVSEINENSIEKNFVGGRNFDNVLVSYFLDQLEDEDNPLVIDDYSKYNLWTNCEKLKHELSEKEKSSLGSTNLGSFIPTNPEVTRGLFEQLSSGLLTQIEEIIVETVASSNSNPDDLEKVFLFGGCSRMPMIQKLIIDLFPGIEVKFISC